MEIQEILSGDKSLRYALLGRMQSDCEYYLGYGCRNPENLWAKDEKKQIEYMKAIWGSFNRFENPDWLSFEKILEFEKEMTGKGIVSVLVERDYKGEYERYALTPEEFNVEFAEFLAKDMSFPNVDGDSYTINPLVHVWYQKGCVGDENWNRFFTDMTWGLLYSDAKSGNHAYVSKDKMQSLKKYLAQLPKEEKGISLHEKIEAAKGKSHLDSLSKMMEVSQNWMTIVGFKGEAVKSYSYERKTEHELSL